MKKKTIDMSGKRFSSIVAIRPTGVCSSGDTKWLFECDCGVLFEANGYYARSGKVTTCPSCSAERVRLASVKHGKSETPEFFTWTDIQTRCHNKNATSYKDYGGRGIVVCARWRESFEAFLTDMGKRPTPKHSIDRLNNNGNYEPGNCRWATNFEQANNKRNTHLLTIDGVTKPLSQWAKESGLSLGTMWQREKSGITGRDLISESKRGGTIVFNGERNTYAGWSKKTGIPQSTIYARIKLQRLPIEIALTK